MPDSIKVKYTNYRGETRVREIIPLNVLFKSTRYHPELQYMLECFDVEKNEIRIYSLKDCNFTETEE